MAMNNGPKNKKINQLNETGRRDGEDRRVKNVDVAEQKRKAPRRRHIDPTTCERDYSEQEIEFMQALDEYKRANGRMFPTCSEILEVLLKLGYRKVDLDLSSDNVPIQSTILPLTSGDDNLFLDDQLNSAR